MSTLSHRIALAIVMYGLGAFGPTWVTGADSAARPNIVLILADDKYEHLMEDVRF